MAKKRSDMTPEELEKAREYNRQNYLQNREAKLAIACAFYERNKARIAENARRRYVENRERICTRQRERMRRLRAQMTADELKAFYRRNNEATRKRKLEQKLKKLVGQEQTNG